eukprot:TRINITY_DN2620_c0_g1_i1.p1 TRINITY_DN2620_c0_g1~~TRINITY_DN2620_c0_g1_i1.p1  ORF type:complete len:347 (-),score=135.36 TRINITY_DN2620_c0_g1_i1:32-1072(-)
MPHLHMSQLLVQEPNVATIVGSGMVGKSWAIVFAKAGFNVHLFDVIPEAAQKSIPLIHAMGQQLKDNNLLHPCNSADELVSRIKACNSLEEALKGALWVQECAPETVELKQKAFDEIQRVLLLEETKNSFPHQLDNIVVASSSSAIPSSSFTSHLNEEVRRRCLIAHPVNPVHLIPLVEIVPASYTSPDVTAKARKILEEVGKKPIVVKREIDSFILNRLQSAVLNEAFKLVEEDYISPEDLDITMKDGLGLRWSFMGPFETIDLNAPLGVQDYATRYSGNMFKLAQQQSEPRQWSDKVVSTVDSARRELLSVDQLQQRAKWRDSRLMGLLNHKESANTAENSKLA